MEPEYQSTRRWRSVNDVLAEWSRYETDEWARITRGCNTQPVWPPRLEGFRRTR